MLTQVGSITTTACSSNDRGGVCQSHRAPDLAGLVTPSASSCQLCVTILSRFSGVRVFSRDYENPRVNTLT